MLAAKRRDKFLTVVAVAAFTTLLIFKALPNGGYDVDDNLPNDILATVGVDDLIAMVFFEQDNSEILRKQILQEQSGPKCHLKHLFVSDFGGRISWNGNRNAGNTKGGSITVPLTSCLTGLD
jgi:hypothetical protein